MLRSYFEIGGFVSCILEPLAGSVFAKTVSILYDRGGSVEMFFWSESSGL